jgi:hypothetical protein
MKIHAKIIDEKTKEVSVPVYENYDKNFFIEMGYELMEVEKAWNGLHYKKGFTPAKPAEVEYAELKEQYEAEISQLTALQNERDIPTLIRYQNEPAHEKYIEAKGFFDKREKQKDELKEKIKNLKG